MTELNEEQLYRRDVNVLKTTDSGRSLLEMMTRFDANDIVSYFLDEVLNIAERYRESRGVDFMDIVGAGNAALTEYIHSQKGLRYTTLGKNVRRAIEKGIKSYILGEIADRTNVDYDSDKLDEMSVETMKKSENEMDREEIGESAMRRAFDGLTSQEKEVLERRYGIGYEKEHILEEIAKVFGLSRQRIRQIEARAIRKLQHPLRAEFLQEYAELVFDNVRNKPGNYDEQGRDLQREICDIKSLLEERLGEDFSQFRAHYALSREEFAQFLRRIYTPLTQRSALKLVHITDAERQKIIERNMEITEGFKELRTMGRTVEHLRSAIGTPDEQIARDLQYYVIEMYVPLFANDKKNCFETLEREATSTKNSPELRAAFRGARDYFAKAEKLKVPGVSTELDDFQKVDLEILAGRRANIIASEMGTGKSLEAIAYAMRNNCERILVVSTKSGAHNVWPSELRKHLDETPAIAVLNGQFFREELFDRSSKYNWFVTTYRTAAEYAPQLRKMGFDLIILDESHKINNEQTKQSVALTTLNASHKMAISGSLFKNRRAELFTVLNWLWPQDFLTVEDFVRDYCKTEHGLARLKYDLGRRMVVRLKEQVLNLPRVEHFFEEVAMSEAQAETYRKMEDDFIEWHEANVGEMSDRLFNRIAFMKLHGLRRAAIAPKIPLVRELLTQSADEGRKSVLYTTYISSVNRLRKAAARFGVCHIVGKTSNEERAQVLRGGSRKKKQTMFASCCAPS